ncbi:MAG: hypothetical protein M5U35_06180 [Roseovarius sp.]|nr:hypothetical protein [Roseovarius sp.]
MNLIDQVISAELSEKISLFNSALILGGFIFTIFQIRQNSKIHRESLEWERRVLTVQALNRRNELDLCGMNEAFDLKNRHAPIPLTELTEKISGNAELEVGIVRYLNYYSGLCLNAERQVYDCDMILKSRGSIIGKSVIRFQHFIEARRQQNGGASTWAGLERFAKTTKTYKKCVKAYSSHVSEYEIEDSAPQDSPESL